MRTSTNSRGFSLLGVMVGFAIVVAVLCLLGAGAGVGLRTGENQQTTAEKEARVYADRLQIKLDALYCADRANRHGWVPCTLRSGSTLRSIECRGAFAYGDTCRDHKLSLPQHTDVADPEP